MSQLQVTGEAKIRDIQGPVVANDGVITALDGAASQYVRGDGTLADFPTSSGGGSSVSYYLNSSVSQGTIGGVAYRELSKEPIIGAGTDIAISANGYVANYITDVNDPDVTIVPGGNFNCEFYFSVNNNTGNPFFYAELYKYDGTTFTLLGSSVGVPEYINQGTIIAPYYFAIPVPTSALALTDRIAIRIYVNVDGRTVTLHTENGHLCQVVTTFSKGMVSLNNLTDQSQFITTGTSGTNFNIVSSGDTHTFNLPVASATNTGKLSNTDWSTFNSKQPAGNYVTIDTTQTITAEKTFSNLIEFNDFVLMDIGVALAKTSGTPLYGGANGYANLQLVNAGSVNSLFLIDGDTGKYSKLSFNNAADYTYTFPAITGTLALLEGTQTFSGAKTFDEGISLKSAAFPTPATGYSSIGGNPFGITIITKQSSTIYTSNLGFPAANRTFTFPNSDGTIALTSNLSSYVPYTGATTNVNLGSYALTTAAEITSKFVFVNGDGTYGGVLAFKQYASSFGSTTGHTTIYAQGYDKVFFSFHQAGGGGKVFNFDTSLLGTTNARTYTMPDASGTLALTSNLSAYLPLTGGTLTGALSGTSATFSGNVTANNGSVFLAVSSLGTVFTVMQSDNTSGYIGTNTNHPLILRTDSTTRLTISASTGAATFSSSVTATNLFTGNSGINVSNFGYLTQTVSGQMTILGHNVKASTSVTNQVDVVNGGWYSSMIKQYYNEGITFHTSDTVYSAGAVYPFAATERMRITSSGNIGIGTSSPSNFDGVSFAGPFFDVAGIMQIKGTSANTIAALQFGGSTFRKALIYSTIGTEDPALIFATASSGSSSSAAERMRITSGGNLLVGTTANDFGSRQVNFSSTSYTFHSVRNGTGSEGHLVFSNANGAVGSIFTNGSATFYNATSDYRLKEDLKDYNGIDLVCAIKTYDYQWKSDKSRMYGVMAHELQEVLPYAVTGEKDAEQMQQVDYSKLTPINTKAIQELYQLVLAQDAKIEELKSLIAAK